MRKANVDAVAGGKYVNRVFWQFLLLVTVPLILMGFISYSIFTKGEARRNALALELYGENVVSEYENVFSSIREYYLDAVSGDNYYWLLEQRLPPYAAPLDATRAQTLLQGNHFLTKYISRYDFLNLREGWILNNYGMFSYGSLRNLEEVESFLQQQKSVPFSIYWKNRLELSAQGAVAGRASLTNRVDTTGFQLVLKQDTSTGGTTWMLLVQLNQSELAAIAKKYRQTGYEITVLCEGSVLSQTSESFTQAYLQTGSQPGAVITDAQGVGYNYLQIDPLGSSITYLIGYDVRKDQQGGWAFFLAALGIMVGFALLLVALRALAKAFSKPVLLLQKYVDDQDLQIRRQLTLDLIRGSISEEKLQKALREFSIESFASYRMMGVVCKQEQGASPQDMATVLRSLPETLLENACVPAALLGSILFLVVGDENDLAGDQKTAMAYLHLKDFISETYGLQIASGISRPFYQLQHVRRAYQECLETLHDHTHSQSTAISSLVLYDDYGAVEGARNTYDIIMENELVSAIDGCNEEEAHRLLELILERMHRKGVTGVERNFYVTKLMTSILAVPTHAGVALNDVFGSGQYNIIQAANQLYDGKALLAYLSDHIIAPILVRLAQERQTGVSEVVKQALQQIKDTKGMINLNECAALLNYHPNYLSKVIAKEKGLTFTDLVNEEKLKRAKFMLLTTAKPIGEISEELGYNNVQNFIRFFKNQVQTTPAAFRRAHKNESIK